MRLPLVAFAIALALGAASPGMSAPAAKPSSRPSSVPPAIAAQRALVQRLAKAQLRPEYADAQLELSRRYQAANQPAQALEAALAASSAFDRQVELHKALSEQLTPYERARAERKAAHDLGLRRDEANFQAAELARQVGDVDAAVQHYVMVVQSQPDQDLGQQALAALQTLGIVAPAPSASPSTQP